MRRSTTFIALAIAGGLLASLGTPASAQRAYGSHYGQGGSGPRYVIAESRFGNGTIEGAIRPGPHGWQVRLPRGTWINCVRACSDTLRRQTVDFWQNQGRDAPDNGRGYLSWEFRF